MANDSSLRKGFVDSAVLKNPILFEAVGLSPVLAMTTSVKAAIILASASCVELILIELFACLALKKVKRFLRMPIYAILGMALNLPIFAFFIHFTPNEAMSVGIFLPLLAVNSLIALHAERYAVKHTLKQTFVDAVFSAFGYAFVILILGILREVIGNGTFYGISLHFPIHLQGLLLPFGAFLLLGFMAAFLKAILQKKMPDAHPERAFSMREIRESHIGALKIRRDTDVNPYADEEDSKKKSKKKHQKMQKPKVKKARSKKNEKIVLLPYTETKETEETILEPLKEEKPKKTKKPQKAEKPKKEKKAKKPQKAKRPKPLTPEQIEKAKAHEAKRLERNDYLLDFDEMLSDLDTYKKQQAASSQKKTEESDVLQEKGGDAE